MNGLLVLNCIAAALIVGRACCVLNAMSCQTRHSIRAAYVIIGLGAFLVMIDPMYFDPDPTFSEVLLHVGFAVLMFANIRKPAIAPSFEGFPEVSK